MWVLLTTLALAAPPELVDALSMRHPTATCDALAAEHGVDALIEVAEGYEMPPWLPMRAAHCVGAHAIEGEVAIRRWLADADTPGLAAAAVAGLEEGELPPGLDRAVKARLDADARFVRIVQVDRSRHPELRALTGQGESK